MHPILLLEVYVVRQPFIKLQVKTVPWKTRKCWCLLWASLANVGG